MAPNIRVVNAFRAMKAIGIPEEKTKPVLKKLLIAYEKNWEPIEDENYRVLIDAIFDSDESELAEQKKKLDDAEVAERKKVEQAERMKAIEDETQIQEEPEKPLKRQRVRLQDDQASPSCISPNINSGGYLLKKPKLEINELLGSQPELQSPAEIKVTGSVLRTEPQPLSPPKEIINNEKQDVLPIILMKPKAEVPLAFIMPESLTNGDDTSTENNLVKEPDPTKTMNSSNCVQETSNETNGSTGKIDLASSSSGEIKLSLTCKLREGKPKFSFENADSVLKTMEDKCLKSYKFLDPNFSLKKLMKDMCECFLDIGVEYSGEPPVNTDAISPTENGFEENNPFIPDETVDIAKEQDSVVNTDAISPTDMLKTGNDYENETENGCEENNHFIPDETVDIAKEQVSVANTDAMSPTALLKTGNESEKETENGFEENNHFIPDETVDIAKGEESVVISLVNEVNSECPQSFHYIPRSAIFQNAYVNFSLARITKENCCSTCFGNCLTASTPCQCAMQNGGEFAYTNEGTIKEDLLDDCIQTSSDPQKRHLSYCKECPLVKPKNEGVLGTCKGHLERSFIKECWLKCGCDKKCGNRVVQSGVRYKLQVFMTPGGKGWGLRALEDLPKGAFVCEFVGEVLTCKELYYRLSQSSKKDEYAYPVFLDAEWGEESELQEDETLCLDATSYGNVSRFINHRCFDANLIEIPVEVENSDRHYYHLAFFTTRKVEALEELTWDYGIDFDDNDDPVKAFECQCGSGYCRNIKRSSGSRKRKLVLK